MLADCDVIVIFLIHGQLGANRKPDSGRIVLKTYIFINSNLLSQKRTCARVSILIKLSASGPQLY